MTSNLEKLLQKTADAIEKELNLSHITSGESFENHVYKKMRDIVALDKSLPQKIYHTGNLAFPDIIVDDIWGVEVKFSNSGKWNSLGNSIFEGTSVGGIQEIYVLFGKKNGNKIEVKFDLYENCVTDVKVTHSPRFIVSLEEERKSLFEELDIKYNEFKNLDKSLKGKQIKDYFRKHLKPGDDVWWIDQEESETLPKVRTFNNLDKDEQNQLMIEAFILFPEVLSNTNHSKYNRVAPYWLTQYQVYNPSLRDKFSASGQVKIGVPPLNEKVTVSKIYGVLYHLAPNIHDYLLNHSSNFFETLKEKWEEINIDPTALNHINLVDFWLILINQYGVMPFKKIKPSDVFKAGLLNKKEIRSIEHTMKVAEEKEKYSS
jgi:hypothetical protein